jgi:hypothetical protein
VERCSVAEQRDEVAPLQRRDYAHSRFWHETDIPCEPTNVCSWGKSGRAADITTMTEVDPEPKKTHAEILHRTNPLRTEVCYPLFVASAQS